jgi:hypothetical protein
MKIKGAKVTCKCLKKTIKFEVASFNRKFFPLIPEKQKILPEGRIESKLFI